MHLYNSIETRYVRLVSLRCTLKKWLISDCCLNVVTLNEIEALSDGCGHLLWLG